MLFGLEYLPVTRWRWSICACLCHSLTARVYPRLVCNTCIPSTVARGRFGRPFQRQHQRSTSTEASCFTGWETSLWICAAVGWTVVAVLPLACWASFSRCCSVSVYVSSCRSSMGVYIMGASLLPVMRVSFSLRTCSISTFFLFLHYFACGCHSRSLFLSLLRILLQILHYITRSLTLELRNNT